MNSPTLFILCGLPFSGKSTFAKTLTSILTVQTVSLDEIKAKAGFINISDNKISQSDWDCIFALYFNQISEALSNGQSVISDSTNTTIFMREELRQLANKTKATTKLIYLHTPPSVIKERILLNRDRGEREDISDEDFEAVQQNFEEPSTAEQPLLFNHNDIIETWIIGNALG